VGSILKSANPKKIFIVGVGRSGTSLLQSMFASHPQVKFIPETSFIRRYVLNGKLQYQFKSGRLDDVINILRSDTLFARANICASSLVKNLKYKSGLLDSQIYREMSQIYSDKNQYWVGDKDPRLTEFLPIVKSLYSMAIVVNIIRDPRDILVSKKQAAWSKGSHVWKHIFANRVQLSLSRFNGPRLFGKNYHEIIYEELLSDPNKVLTKLCIGIGLPFTNKMLSFNDAARKLVSDSEMSWKKETLGPLLKNNVCKWKSRLSYREIRLTELCCCEAMVAGNYDLDNRRQSFRLTDWFWIFVGATIVKLFSYLFIAYRQLSVNRACTNYN
jgi:hypothetical protein